MNDCVFCKIIRKEIQIPADVYEDSSVFVFLAKDPVSAGHTLVIPKGHFENIYSIEDGAMKELGLALKRVSAAVKKAVGADGINIHMNNEKAAGQEVFHAHFHIIPRFAGDGLEHWHPGHAYKNDEIQDIAAKIGKNM
jgi:histidine triad (HIT) family protein